MNSGDKTVACDCTCRCFSQTSQFRLLSSSGRFIGWLRIFLAAAILLIGSGIVSGAPTTAYQAQKVVEGWLRADGKPLNCTVGKTVSRVDTHYDASGSLGYYIVYLNPKGFVIVSADDQVEPIVGFASSGTFDPSPDNPLAALVSRDIPGRMQAARNAQRLYSLNASPQPEQDKWHHLTQAADTAPMQSLTESLVTLSAVSDVRVAPLVASRWSQTYEGNNPCYNYYVPNGWPCGCVATAMAQVMRFHKFPTNGIGANTFSFYVAGSPSSDHTRGGDGAGGPYNWDLMTLDPDGTTPDEQRAAIGALCYDAGLAVHMMYSGSGSGAYMDDCTTAMVTTFGYSNIIDGYSYGGLSGTGLNTMINPNLDAGLPVILAITGNAGGHAIVADGYGYNTTTLYHHLNLGWGGTQDAWYNLPSVATAYYTFNTVADCIYNIFPSGSGEIISGRVLDGAGKPLVGAMVTATPTGGDKLTTTTNSAGIYAFAKVPSNTQFTVAVTGQSQVYLPKTVTTGKSTSSSTTVGNLWGINFSGTAETPPTATASSANARVGQTATITLQATDDGRPADPGVLSCIIVSLPKNGTLADPNGSTISTVPYTLLSCGKQVAYTPTIQASGTDSFTFKAYDGGTAPTGGYSKTATVSITIKFQIYMATMDEDPGWTLDTGWGYGTPSGGGSNNHDPSAGYTGQNVIGYNLAGDYSNYIATPAYATTPAIDCRGYWHTKLSFYRWLGVGVGKYDKASIQASSDGTTWTTIWSNAANTTAIKDTAWQRLEYDISKVADCKQTVYIRWGMGPTSYYTTYPGWNIDDVEVFGDPYTPSVQFAKTVSSGSESSGTVDIPVVLSNPSLKIVTVPYTIKGGTAANGSDYTLTAGTLTFSPNDTTENITITIVDDQIGEINKTIQLQLGKPTNATLGTNTVHTFTLIDDDPIDCFATGETKSIGTVAGTFASTAASDNIYESIKEVVKSGTKYSQLEHRWTFNVRGGANVTFNLEAWCSTSTDGDTFTFAYSTNGTTYTNMVTVGKTSDDNTIQTFALPSTVKGTVYVRVRDNNRTQGNTGLDTIYVDQMFFHCE